MSKSLSLNKDWFAISTAGAFGVVSGVVITDDALDATARAVRSHSKTLHRAFPFDKIPQNLYEKLGPLVFLMGWVLVLFSACTHVEETSKDQQTLAYDPLWSTLVLISGISIIVFAMLSQTYMRKQNIEHVRGSDTWKMLFGGLFAISWYAFVTFLSFEQDDENAEAKFDVTKFIFGFIGATLIIVGMMVLLKNRVVTAAIPSVYNFGLPLFCFGWFFVVMQISLFERD